MQHTPGPWRIGDRDPYVEVWGPMRMNSNPILASMESEPREANARLMAAAPEMLAALKAVNKLISEAAMTGFNCHDGDWAERLFFSQQATHAAIRKATDEFWR